MSRDSRSQSGMIFPSGLKDAITYTRFVIIDHLRFIIQTYVRKINRENSKILKNIRGLSLLPFCDMIRSNHWFYGVFCGEDYPVDRDQLIHYFHG